MCSGKQATTYGAISACLPTLPLTCTCYTPTRNDVLRLRFEVDYASRMDGKPDAPGEDEKFSLAEKQAELEDAQAALEVRRAACHGQVAVL